MPLKASGPSGEWETIDRVDGGVGWLAHPAEDMLRASHAIVEDGDVWLIDPLDAPEIDDLLDDLGTVAGVVLLLDRHTRDAEGLARRHDVPVYLPGPLHGVAADLDAPVERFRHDLGDTSYAAHALVDRWGWHEAALYSDETGVLVVPEALGTADYFRVDDERVGVHPALRAFPPRSLARLAPDHLLVGHGRGLHEGVPAAIRDAVDGSRRRMPALYWKALTSLIG